MNIPQLKPSISSQSVPKRINENTSNLSNSISNPTKQNIYNNKTIFFKKQYKLMIHTLTLEEQIRATYFTGQCADYTTIPNGIFNICINNTVDFNTIDITTEKEQIADLEVNLDISHFAKGIKNDLGKVTFRVDKEKILAPSSVNFYTANLSNRKGQVQYKFIGLKKKEITQQELIKSNERKQQVIRLTQQLQQNSQLKRVIDILDGKDQVIKNLQKKIASLIEQTHKLNRALQRQLSEQKKQLKQGLNLNLNINASNNYHMKKINDKLSEDNAYLQKRLDDLEEEFQELDRKLYETKCENNILQIQLGKKQVEPQIIVNPSVRILNKKQSLDKIQELEYDQQLERKSKLADSIFMAKVDNSDNVSVKSARNRQKRNQTMNMNAKDNSVLVSNLVTPRGRSRTHSMLEPNQMFHHRDLSLSKVHVDQEQVMQQLKNLKQNLQVSKQQNNTTRYPKLQAAIKSSYRMIQRLNDQKLILQQKIKLKDQQIAYINNQLQRSKANFRSFQKQLRQRTSNAKQQFDQRMAAIKLQTQMRIQDMRRNNRFSDYQNVMQQQKRQIQMQKMRFQNQSIKQKYQEALNEIKALQAQRTNEMNKYKTTENTLNKEKQMYKSKYYQMQDSYTKQQEELSIMKEKAEKFQMHIRRIQQLQQTQRSLKTKIQQEQKQIQDLIKKCKRYEDKFVQIEPKWDYYREIQGQHQVLKRRNTNLIKMNQRFQSRLQELKKFTLKLQNAYYQKKQKNQSDQQFNELYQRQMQQKIQQTVKKLRMYQKQFYQEQIHELTQSKRQQIQYYYKKIADENVRIQQSPIYTEQQKQKFKVEKQHEINLIKQAKLDQLQKKIVNYKQLLGKLQISEEYLPKGLNEKISYLQEKLRKFELGQLGVGVMSQSSQSQMKNTIDRLNDSVKQKQSQITQLKKTIGKMSDGSNLLKVNNIQATFANQRKSMIQQMAKSRQIFSRSFQDLKRANSQLLKQKSQLQIQLQNHKFKQQKLLLKNQQRQRQLERVNKKNTDEFKAKIANLQRALEKKSDQNIKNKLQKQEFKENMATLIGQLNSTARLLQNRQNDLVNLQAQNQALKERIEQYEQAQKTLVLQVKKVKEQSAFNQKQFRALLQDRNQSFIKIQKIKDTQIQKLKNTIQTLQIKLQTQVSELLHTKQDLQNLQLQFEDIQAKLQQTKVSYNVVNENYQKVEQQSVLKIHQLQQTNQLLQRHLIQIAQQVRQLQMQLHESKINKQSLQLQIKSLQALKNQLLLQQTQFKKTQRKYEQIIQEQNQKLRELEEKYKNVEHKIKGMQNQNQELHYKIINYQNEIQQSKEKMNKKYEQFNEVKSKGMEFQIKNKYLEEEVGRLKGAVEKLEKENKELESVNGELNQQMEQFNNKNQRKVEFLNVNELTKSTNLKTKLKPPPKTQMMSNSNYEDLGMSKMMKSSRMNDLGASGVVNRKNIIDPENKGFLGINIQEDQSLRGTQINADLNQNENSQIQNIASSQSIPQMRKRMWTVREHEEQMLHSRGDPEKLSQVDFQYKQQSHEQSDLESQMSKREPKNQYEGSRLVNRIKNTQQAIQLSQMAGSNWKAAQSMSQNAAIEQYLKQIQNLKEENKKILEEKQFLQVQNNTLKDRIAALTGDVEQKQRKNLLTSALGLTAGLLMRQTSQRGSVQKQNSQNKGIPPLKIRSGTQSPLLSPAMNSKQTIKIQQNDSIQGDGYRPSSKRSNKSINSPGMSPTLSKKLKNSSIQKSSSQGNRNNQVTNGFARSSVQDIKSSRRQSLQGNRNRMTNQQIARANQLQLVAEQLQQQNRQLKHLLEQQQQNNQRLMDQIVLIQQSQQQKHQLLQQKNAQIEQITNFYEQIKQQLQQKIQKLVEQQIQKQTEQVKLLKTFDVKNQEIENLNKKIELLERSYVDKITENERLVAEKQKAYVQFRKYEEEAELEILRLKEELTAVKEAEVKVKKQVQLIAQDYFQLQQAKSQLQQDIGQKDTVVRKKDSKLQQITNLYQQTVLQLKKLQQSRKSTNKQIFDLQNQITLKQNQMQQLNKSTSLLIKKYQIKLNTSYEQSDRLKQKIQQKDHIIQTLKHQIALYNEETDKLKELNKELTLELERTEKQLKEIMKSYEAEFENLSVDVKNGEETLGKYKQLVAEKDQEVSRLTKIIKKLENETRSSHDSEFEIKQAYDKYKQAKQKQIQQTLAQLQIKNNQYLRLKTLHEKQTEQYFVKQSQYLKKLAQQQQIKKGFKQKLLKYQTVLQQLEKQLSIMSQRPTKQQYDQIQFQNQLYKNRIQELQQMLRQFAPQAQSNKFHNSQQGIMLQYKKYKLQKQRQLDDLSNQIQKYSLKINQLQQINFIMKKNIQKFKAQINHLVQENQELKNQNYNLKEDIDEINQEMEFYKGKRIENLSKLLNQTM